jgi:hypothetical protein
MSEGIKETKDLVIAIASIGAATAKSLDGDGKISLTDAANYFPALMKLPAAVAGISEVPAELADLEPSELEELQQTLVDEFDVPQESVKELVEDSLKAVAALYGVIYKHFLTKEA